MSALLICVMLLVAGSGHMMIAYVAGLLGAGKASIRLRASALVLAGGSVVATTCCLASSVDVTATASACLAGVTSGISVMFSYGMGLPLAGGQTSD